MTGIIDPASRRHGHRLVMRYGISLLLLGFYAAACAAHAFATKLYDLVMPWLIGFTRPYPFDDLASIMQAGLCWRHGVDVYLHNACMGGGHYNYSILLLHAAYLPYTMQDLNAAGVGLGLLFILSLAALPPAVGWREFSFRCAAALSACTVFALESGNFDMIIFIAVVLSTALLSGGLGPRLAGYALLALAASCKFYPVLALSLMLREPAKVFLSLVLLLAALACIYALYFAPATLKALQIVPIGPPFNDVFGASNLPFGLSLLIFSPEKRLDLSLTDYLTATRAPLTPVIFLLGPLVLTMLAVLRGVSTARVFEAGLRQLAPGRLVCLITGAILVTGCFFLAQNIAYRAIFLLLAQPGLAALAGQDRGFGWRLNTALVMLMWEPTIRHVITSASHGTGAVLAQGAPIAAWVGFELLWWWVIINFCALLAAFARPEWLRLWRSWRGVAG